MTITTYSIAVSGDYQILSKGASGGSAFYGNSVGSLGATVSGVVHLYAGTVLSIAVGGQGQYQGSVWPGVAFKAYAG